MTTSNYFRADIFYSKLEAFLRKPKAKFLEIIREKIGVIFHNFFMS